jgi:hypothetical protein
MGLRSGAQHTVAYALEQGKEVMAVPGPIGFPSSEGTNQLIKDGARVVTSAADVIEELFGVGRERAVGGLVAGVDESVGIAFFADGCPGSVARIDDTGGAERPRRDRANALIGRRNCRGHRPEAGRHDCRAPRSRAARGGPGRAGNAVREGDLVNKGVRLFSACQPTLKSR